jgi:hypothetical protein
MTHAHDRMASQAIAKGLVGRGFGNKLRQSASPVAADGGARRRSRRDSTAPSISSVTVLTSSGAVSLFAAKRAL